MKKYINKVTGAAVEVKDNVSIAEGTWELVLKTGKNKRNADKQAEADEPENSDEQAETAE